MTRDSSQHSERPRFHIVVPLLVGLLLVIALFAGWRMMRRGSPENSTTQAPSGNESAQLVSDRPAESQTAPTATPTEPAPTPVQTKAVPTAAPPVNVDPAIAGLVANLARVGGSNVMASPEMVAAWRQGFQQLVQQGSAGVPAIQAFLNQQVDYVFNRDVQQSLGYGSARMAMLDALRQIGGPDATAAMSQTLGQTSDPREIAVLARNLDELAQGQYRDQALAATREALSAIAAGTAKAQGVDTAPLFEVFQRYGDASVIADLEQAIGGWKYYAVVALANLPDGSGIPSLFRLAQGDENGTGSDARIQALEMLTQLATDNAAARDFLRQQTQKGQISPRMWPYLLSSLTGDQYHFVDSAINPIPNLQSWSDLKTTHIVHGNQNLYTVPGDLSLTPDGINQRITFVNELLGLTSDPAALQTLQQAQGTLQTRLMRNQSAAAGAASGQP